MTKGWSAKRFECHKSGQRRGSEAGGGVGCLVTAPFPLTGGSVWVNVDASEGFVQAEMLDEQGSCCEGSGLPIRPGCG
jgi:hypothetical protein